MNAGEPIGYSATTVEHFRHPRNVGRLNEANALGVVDDKQTENFISIYLRVEKKRITAATFRTFGCSACVAASSMVTVLASGQTLAQASNIDGGRLLAALEGLPAEKRHCADLAAQALAAALDDFHRNAPRTRTADQTGRPAADGVPPSETQTAAP